MSLPILAFLALILMIVLAMTLPINIGATSLGLSLVIGYYIAGQKVADIVKSYPTSLFIMMAGVTYFFAMAQVNGTLEKIIKYTLKSVKGNTAVLPIIFFFVAFVLSAIGPGQNASFIMAPIVMLLAEEAGIAPLLLAIATSNGVQAGTLSPIALGGVVVAGITQKMGLSGLGGILWLNQTVAHFIMAIVAYLIFGGLKLWKVKDAGQRQALADIQVEPFTRNQLITLIAIVVFIIGVVFFKLDVGLGGFLFGTILAIFKIADEGKALKQMPWGIILFITGVMVLVDLMSKIGGMEVFASIISRLATPLTLTLVTGFICGVISAYAGTMGFVLPAFMPLAPVLMQKVGAPETFLLPMLSTILVCGFLVDFSPLSATGAIFYANAGERTDKQKLFRQMITWGLSMAVAGSILCWLCFTVLRLP